MAYCSAVATAAIPSNAIRNDFIIELSLFSIMVIHDRKIKTIPPLYKTKPKTTATANLLPIFSYGIYAVHKSKQNRKNPIFIHRVLAENQSRRKFPEKENVIHVNSG